MKKNTITNKQRPVEIPDGDDLKVWCHLAPFGEFKRIWNNQEITQLCDKQAFEALIASFEPEGLVDFEHQSEDSWDTSAAGWAQELRLAEDGLEVLINFTDIGAETVRNRRLRFLSPTWSLDAAGRPVAINSIALTNKPYFDLRPVLNKETGTESPAAEAGQKKTTNKKGIQTMDTKQIALALGLAEDATADEILAAVKAAKDKAASLESRLAELENKQLEDEAAKVADENEDKIENKEAFKKLYVSNKDVALQVLATLKAPAPATPVTNKTNAKPPAAFTGGGAVKNKLDEYDAMPEGKDKVAFLRANAKEIHTLRNKRDAD
jgi:phage I-like protein